MGQRVKKTGLAKRMRKWMREQTRAFSPAQLCDALDIAPGPEREKVRSALPDFVRRGEAEKVARGKYRHNQAWRTRRKSPLKEKIFKAMHVSSRFTVRDIQRLTGQKGRNYIDCMVVDLRDQGYISQVCRCKCAHGRGSERVWRVADQERFRIEVMK